MISRQRRKHSLRIDSDTTDYTMTTDPETGKVTLVIANASGEDITIEIAEKGDGGVIQISPSSDTNNNIVEAIKLLTLPMIQRM